MKVSNKTLVSLWLPHSQLARLNVQIRLTMHKLLFKNMNSILLKHKHSKHKIKFKTLSITQCSVVGEKMILTVIMQDKRFHLRVIEI